MRDVFGVELGYVSKSSQSAEVKVVRAIRAQKEAWKRPKVTVDAGYRNAMRTAGQQRVAAAKKSTDMKNVKALVGTGKVSRAKAWDLGSAHGYAMLQRAEHIDNVRHQIGLARSARESGALRKLP